MARKLMVSMLLGLTLVSVGCVERRHYGRGDRQGRLDINNASQRELSSLPGITDDDAHRIVANRPYPNPEALVRRGVIGPRKFDGIESYVYAGDAGRERRDDRDRWDDRDRYDDRHHYDDDRYDHR
jgi:hypothetical protein